MKSLILASCLLLSTNIVNSQSCDYYYLQDGKTAELTNYNRKGDEVGKNVYKISSVKKSGGSTTSQVQTELFDKKGKSFAKASNSVKCTDGSLMIDMKMFLSPEQAGQIKAEAKASDVYLAYPPNMKPGDALPDGKFNMEVQQDNGMTTKVDVNITDRKVAAQEAVTTPAGTWQCFKITYRSAIKIGMMGIGIPVRADVTEWFAPGFGTVKTEAKGSTTVLTKFQ
jgi:hypothetical protein